MASRVNGASSAAAAFARAATARTSSSVASAPAPLGSSVTQHRVRRAGYCPLVLIRPFEPTEPETDAVIALWQACGLTRPWNDPHQDIARKLQVQRELFLVGEADGQVIATTMAGYDGHRGWVNYLAVAPGQRGQGLGAALMQHIEQQLLALGCPKLNLQVRSSNTAVLDFYRHLGYAQDEVVSLGKRLIPDGP